MHNEKGFTLIELVAAIFALIFIGLGLTLMFGGFASSTFNEVEAQTAIVKTVDYADSEINITLDNDDVISIPDNQGQPAVYTSHNIHGAVIDLRPGDTINYKDYAISLGLDKDSHHTRITGYQPK